MATDKERAENLMLDIDNMMKNSGFSTYLFFCVGDKKEGGFCSINIKEEKDMHLKAQIIDTLRHNPTLHDWLQNILDNV